MLLIAEGSTGRTYNQLQRILELPSNLANLRSAYKNVQRHLTPTNSSAVELDMSQALISDINNSVNDDYSRILTEEYCADHLSVDFHDAGVAVEIINTHIYKNTHGKIQRFVEPNNLADAHLLLTSATYFKGKWKV